MSRLTTDLLLNIKEELPHFNKTLSYKTGLNLFQIAQNASGITYDEISSIKDNFSTGIIPVTAGKGIIQGFTEAVKAIINYLGFSAFITSHYDVSGIAEAIENKADVIFLADDNSFVAVDLQNRNVIDNSEATAKGYISALKGMIHNISQEKILVIGAGRVGEKAIKILKNIGSEVGVYDINLKKSIYISKKYKTEIIESISEGLEKYPVIFDASPASGIIDMQHVEQIHAIAACGIPICLSKEAYSVLRDRVIHDPLQIGVATMLFMAIDSIIKNR